MTSSKNDPINSTRDELSLILSKMDRDLATQLVLAAVSQKYTKVAEMVITCSDVMYLREMKSMMEQPIEQREFSIFEIEDQLKRLGYVV
ncbi:MAG: hypothetical protein WC761_02080 [Candidatus Paceibacterota bacterium]|jgi:hypothetical protein